MRRPTARARRLLAVLCLLVAGSTIGCGSLILRPELRQPAARRDALALAEAVEDLIDRQVDKPDDREAAYDEVCKWRERTAAYGYARASLAGRLAQIRGLTAIPLITEMEAWARYSIELDPHFRGGAARRMLGTLYSLAPAALVKHGDSEKGLELLEELVEEYPDAPENRLRLAEAYISLDDPDPSFEHLCRCLAQQRALRPSEQRLLATLVEDVGGRAALGCRATAQ
jgi:predicted Zn-dependent protease